MKVQGLFFIFLLFIVYSCNNGVSIKSHCSSLCPLGNLVVSDSTFTKSFINCGCNQLGLPFTNNSNEYAIKLDIDSIKMRNIDSFILILDTFNIKNNKEIKSNLKLLKEAYLSSDNQKIIEQLRTLNEYSKDRN